MTDTPNPPPVPNSTTTADLVSYPGCGEVLGECCRLIAEVSRGSMNKVYKALDTI